MEMKKKLLFCIALISMFNCYSQALSGKVIYKIQLAGNGVDLKNSPNREFIEATIEIANKQTTTLLFNSTRSSTVLDQYLVLETGNSRLRKFARSMAFIQTVGSDYFFDKSTNTAIERKENGQLVSKTNEKLEWEITTESKMIDDFLCYKAIYFLKFVNRSGNDTSIPITAWFAPSLPYSYGPKHFNGLPGLILELEDRETSFLASSITISNESEAIIDFPKGKTIPKDDFDEKMKAQRGR
jgi:GLPGLI family protein